jgi:hypothetical protein
MNSSLMCLYGEVKPSSLVKEKTTGKTRHVCLYGEAKPVEQLDIDEAVKHGRRTRNIGAALGECVGNHEVGVQRNKRWRTARLINLTSNDVAKRVHRKRNIRTSLGECSIMTQRSC